MACDLASDLDLFGFKICASFYNYLQDSFITMIDKMDQGTSPLIIDMNSPSTSKRSSDVPQAGVNNFVLCIQSY
jgi:hypothetical protein